MFWTRLFLGPERNGFFVPDYLLDWNGPFFCGLDYLLDRNGPEVTSPLDPLKLIILIIWAALWAYQSLGDMLSIIM